MRAFLTDLGRRLPLCLLLTIVSGGTLAKHSAPVTDLAAGHAGAAHSQRPQTASQHPELAPHHSPGVASAPFFHSDGDTFQGRRLADREGRKQEREKRRGQDDRRLERDGDPRANRLPPAERKKLEERKRRFRELPPGEQRRLLEARERFRQLPPEERARLREKWRQLSPEERHRWRETEPEPEH